MAFHSAINIQPKTILLVRKQFSHFLFLHLTMMIPAIIVDDDRINIKFLSNLILTYCPEISIVETATNVEDGIKALVLHKPQLLFLDIEIHSQTGFDILNLFEDASIQVIFITAHEKYAIKAIQYEVVDYVLKPIKIEDLLAAVKRCKVRLQSLQNQDKNTIQPKTFSKF